MTRPARLLSALLLLCASLAAPPALAEEPVSPGAVDFDYGYFCAREPAEIGVAEGTIAGVVNLVDGIPAFIARGTVVPAQVGVGFGVHILVDPAHAGLVDLTIEHPPMGPDKVTRQTWTTELRADDPDYLGYSFDEPYELVPGEWIFTAEAAGRLVYRAGFTVMRADLLPAVSCGPVPLS